MAATELDEVDQAILKIFETRARISVARLAPMIGLAPSTTRERIHRLEQGGIVLGYKAILAPHFARTTFEGWMDVTLASLPLSIHDAFEALIAESTSVSAVFRVSGAYDYLMHFKSGSADDWRQFCERLVALGVSSDRIRFGVVIGQEKGARSDKRR